ncbi:hypothetical protein GCM10023189_10380 [Nibrella saemangeumensis]|uniref:Caspase family p20 domain-containing protein n=1 Tax=Nibrella saemangeumensis TaxID=1084526 RepID=A0ABP8MG62_9BACT
MKKQIHICYLALVGQFSIYAVLANPASDTLCLRNGIKQVVEVQEVYPDKIRYQIQNSRRGMLESVLRSEVAYIVYANGIRDVFNPLLPAKPQTTWLTASTTSNKPEVTLKACIVNEASQVRLELNGAAVPAQRGFKLSEGGCPQGKPFEQLVKLREGDNQAVLIARNEGGETRSTSLTLRYEKVERRLALVIGNANYASGNRLANPVNDATDMANALKQLGFEVMPYTNVDLQGMKKAVEDFGSRLKTEGYQVGLFYYAGHGVQYQGRNFLVPVNASPKIAADIQYQCEYADRVLAFMEDAKVRTNIVILDACRNNPFERSFSRGDERQGLTTMKAPQGTFIAFATSPDNTASDGSGRNGVFTSALLDALRVPNLSIESVFKRVRTEVIRKTASQQTPWDLSSLAGEDFYFLKQ